MYRRVQKNTKHTLNSISFVHCELLGERWTIFVQKTKTEKKKRREKQFESKFEGFIGNGNINCCIVENMFYRSVLLSNLCLSPQYLLSGKNMEIKWSSVLFATRQNFQPTFECNFPHFYGRGKVDKFCQNYRKIQFLSFLSSHGAVLEIFGILLSYLKYVTSLAGTYIHRLNEKRLFWWKIMSFF